MPAKKDTPVKESKKPEAEADQDDATKAPSKSQVTAKAGKRSSKAIKEAEDKAAKLERKASDESPKPKAAVKPSRSKLERRSKNYRKSAKEIDPGKEYQIAEAINLSKKTSSVKFDATVEMHINLAVDPRQADQNIRDSLLLPKGVGKTVKVAVVSDNEAEAAKAGADISSNEEIFKMLDSGQTNFDILIATPSQMPKLGKYARILGPKGLMPNPKSGTVTADIAKAVNEAKTGKIEYRVDSYGIVHLGVGKVSFPEASLAENVDAVLSSIKQNKPNSIKGGYIKAVHLSTSMGPSIKVDLASIN